MIFSFLSSGAVKRESFMNFLLSLIIGLECIHECLEYITEMEFCLNLFLRCMNFLTVPSFRIILGSNCFIIQLSYGPKNIFGTFFLLRPKILAKLKF